VALENVWRAPRGIAVSVVADEEGAVEGLVDSSIIPMGEARSGRLNVVGELLDEEVLAVSVESLTRIPGRLPNGPRGSRRGLPRS
jgi:hypothetical protein